MHPNEEKPHAAYDAFARGDLGYEFRDGVFSRWEEWPASEEAFNEAWS